MTWLAHLLGVGRQMHQGAALVLGIGPPFDQAVALHALQGVGHGRLLDIDAPAQFGLGQAVLLEQHHQGRELAWRHAAGLEHFLQAAVEQPAQQADLVTQGIKTADRHGGSGALFAGPTLGRFPACQSV